MIVQTYYDAWVHQDETVLMSLLDDTLFGVRTFTEDVLFHKQDVVSYLIEHPVTSIQVDHCKEMPYGYLYNLQVKKRQETLNITAKMFIKDGKITKIYETITQDVSRIKCVCSYDGSAFYGYQKQPHQETIQGTIEQAIITALSLQEPIAIHASGRTDKGVHADMQVFHFDVKTTIPVHKIPTLLNNHLPDSIYIISAEEVDQTFHSRYDIVSKEYKYVINHHQFNPIMRQYEWYVGHLDIPRLKEELLVIKGIHDFQTFTKTSSESTIRTIYDVRVETDDTHLYVYVKGNGFLRYMVRYIIGAAVHIATNKMSSDMQSLLEQKDVTIVKDMAPASGLYLHHVEYM